MRYAVVLVLLSLLAPASAAQEAPSARTLTVPGFVLDGATGQPVAGASVELVELRRRVYTDSLGRFTFAGVPEGEYTFATQRIGYAEWIQSAGVSEGSLTVLRIPLRPIVLEGVSTAQVDGSPGGFTLIGFVLDYRTERPVAGASVEIKNLRRRVVTDSAGRFVFPNLSDRPYTFETRRIGYAEHQETSRLREGDVLLVRLSPRPVVLEGITVLADRFETRRKSVGTLSYASEQAVLLRSTASTLADFISEHHHVTRVACPGESGEEMSCLRFRGTAAHPTIYLDDTLVPGGAALLDAFDPDQMYRVEIFPLLHQVRLYTAPYVELLARSARTLPPICIVC